MGWLPRLVLTELQEGQRWMFLGESSRVDPLQGECSWDPFGYSTLYMCKFFTCPCETLSAKKCLQLRLSLTLCGAARRLGVVFSHSG